MISAVSSALKSTIQSAATSARTWSATSQVRNDFSGHNACATGTNEWIHDADFTLGGEINFFISDRTLHPKDSWQLGTPSP